MLVSHTVGLFTFGILAVFCERKNYKIHRSYLPFSKAPQSVFKIQSLNAEVSLNQYPVDTILWKLSSGYPTIFHIKKKKIFKTLQFWFANQTLITKVGQANCSTLASFANVQPTCCKFIRFVYL